MKTQQYNPLVTFAIVAGCSICFCSKGVVIKLSFLANADPVTVLALRMAFAFPVFLLTALVLNWKASKPISASGWRSIVLFGFVGYYFSPLVNFAGLQYVSVGLERMLLYTYPTFVAIGGMVFMGQKILPRTWGAIGLTYVGIVVAYSGEMEMQAGTGQLVWGASLILLSALTYSAFVLWSREQILEIGAIRYTATVLCVSCAFTLVHYFVTGTHHALANLDPVVFRYAGILAVFGTILPSFLMGVGLRRAGAQRFAVLSTIGPVGTIVLAWAFLDEAINGAQLIGLVITLSGGVMISLFKAAESDAPATEEKAESVNVSVKKVVRCS